MLGVIRLDAATVMLQWAVGGLFFLWITTRRREVGLGYGWLSRGVFAFFAATSAALGIAFNSDPFRDACAIAVAVATTGVLALSIVRRKAGVAGQREVQARRSARVAAMTGIDRGTQRFDQHAAEFNPRWDLLGPAIGLVGLMAAGVDAGDPAVLSIVRAIVSAAFLGAITDAMLLGHWYLVQPGLARSPILELVRWNAAIWPFELAVMVWPTGMVSVLNGNIDDQYGGLLGWFWAGCTVMTIGLIGVTRAALKERAYSAVMAATGLLYLAILTAFGMDLVARALLA